MAIQELFTADPVLSYSSLPAAGILLYIACRTDPHILSVDLQDGVSPATGFLLFFADCLHLHNRRRSVDTQTFLEYRNEKFTQGVSAAFDLGFFQVSIGSKMIISLLSSKVSLTIQIRSARILPVALS